MMKRAQTAGPLKSTPLEHRCTARRQMTIKASQGVAQEIVGMLVREGNEAWWRELGLDAAAISRGLQDTY